MTVTHRVLDGAAVTRFVEERCFAPGTGRVGAELEWLISGDADHAAVEAAARCAPFPAGGTVTFEPGGQVELSSRVADGLAAAWTGLETDQATLVERVVGAGAGLLGSGVHPDRWPKRVLGMPRYDAMEQYWASGGEHEPGAGLAMMCTTAAIQVSLDAIIPDTGTADPFGPGGADNRWRLAHALSPVLSASFANSPIARGHVTGWKSSRLGIWEALDRTRTSPALRTGRAVEDWAAYLLDANVMLIRDGQHHRALAAPYPFGRWMAEGHQLGWPDLEDLAYHQSTLFPPVRAKGWLELRCMDALPEPWWPVAIAVTTALLDDPEAADAAARAAGRAAWCWCEAPRWGLGYEPLAEAARQCFALATDALARMDVPPPLTTLVDAYRDRYVEQARCPADDTLDALAERGVAAIGAGGP